MDLNLKEKVFIVTGGSSGIGEAITRTLADEGAIPVIASRSVKKSKDLVVELKSKGGDALFIEVMLGTGDSCKMVIDQTIDQYGKLDGLINNAGVNDGVGLEKGSPNEFLESLYKNLHHYYYLAHYSLGELKKSKGSIINISSKTAITGQGNTSGYAASKGAQLALTREWAVELAKYKIRVNAIIPAEVWTPLYEDWINTFDNPKQKISDITQNIPLEQRMTTAEEIAAMAVFLLSDKAAHITGQHLFVDGGYVHLDRALNTLNT